MNFLAKKFGGTTKAWIAAILISSLMFGLMHLWKSPRGMVSTAIGALALGAGYVLSKRNLLPVTIAHAAGNTVGFVVFYLD